MINTYFITMALNSPPHIQAKIYLLTHKEGGRSNPFFSPYQCEFRPYTYNSSNSIVIENANPENTMLAQREEVLCNIWFVYGTRFHVGKLHEGFHFKLQVGSEIVGEACITKVFAEELHHWHAETLLAEFKQKQLQDVSNSFKNPLRKIFRNRSAIGFKETTPLFKNSYFSAHFELSKGFHSWITYEDLTVLSLGQHRLKCTNHYTLNGKEYELYDIATWNDKSYALCQVYSEKTVAYGI